SDLDASTLSVLGKGARNVEILKQNLHQPYPVELQIAILFCGTRNLLSEVPVKRIREFEMEYLEYLKMRHPEILLEMKNGNLTDKAEETMTRVVQELTPRYKN
ncbi:MAG: F0F1 ATP synthase subunit alpha, partial [Bacteroidales bacterium]